MEFKRLSDVEAVTEPSESANVLIEENGVVKKAHKTSIGGDSVYYIFLKDDIVTTTDGLYDAIIEKLFTNPVGISVRAFNFRSYETESCADEFTVNGFTYLPENNQISVNCSSGMIFYLYKDGNHSYYWD